ncbi:MAG: hypothetical protein SW833_05610 [Cyanobacteriota bacterium]|nr:hypothetical protein [Cyanobacteriota bacterium]
MDEQALKEKVVKLESQRDFLIRLLEQPNLGTLRLDVNQALEELDELHEEFKLTFPAE